MKASELRNKSEQELQSELLALRKEQFTLRAQGATGQANSSHQFRQIRQNIARIKTVLNEKKQHVDA
ncbi:MAG: 50S ribosomal protein L29 [Gammaproteobacteria bacterium]|nr:50S ribosomal protein L29 [Gammaproteobacteria bacterium]